MGTVPQNLICIIDSNYFGKAELRHDPACTRLRTTWLQVHPIEFILRSLALTI